MHQEHDWPEFWVLTGTCAVLHFIALSTMGFICLFLTILAYIGFGLFF